MQLPETVQTNYCFFFPKAIQWVGGTFEIVTQVFRLPLPGFLWFPTLCGSLSHMSKCCFQSTGGRLKIKFIPNICNMVCCHALLSSRSWKAGFLRNACLSSIILFPKMEKLILGKVMRGMVVLEPESVLHGTYERSTVTPVIECEQWRHSRPWY